MHRQDWTTRLAREHPGLVDTGVVAFALTGSLASIWFVATLVPWPVAVLLNGLPPLALAGRRRAPRVMVAVLIGTGLVQWALAVPFNGAQLAVLAAVWSTAAHGPALISRVMLAAGLALAVIAPLRQPYTGPANTALAAVLLVVVHLIGSNSGLRRDYLRALEERAERLEHERDVAAEVAAARERTRIARELHDVVAHHVSVMVVQAEGAGWAVERQPERARTAIATVTSTGRTALTELRRLLGVLRSGDEDGVAPQPGFRDLEALVSDFRSSGIGVSSQVQVDESLDPGLQLAAYRIVQEGLTNVLKHAGPEARVEVRVRLTDGALRIEIEDDGESAPPSGSHDHGHGLIGIRERAALFGGAADFGPGPGGGFRVRATLPAERGHS